MDSRLSRYAAELIYNVELRRTSKHKPVKEVSYETKYRDVFDFLQGHYATILQICHNAGRNLMTGGSEMQWRNDIDRLLLDLFDDKPSSGARSVNTFNDKQSSLSNDWMVITSYAIMTCYCLSHHS